MPGTSPNDPSPAFDVVLDPAHLRQYPAHDLVAWRPEGVLDDHLLDQIGEWLCTVEKTSAPFRRFVDFSRLTSVAVRTRHVFAFARKRTKPLAEAEPVKSALFSEDWVGFGIAQFYESLMKETALYAKAFRDRAAAAIWLGVPLEILKLEG